MSKLSHDGFLMIDAWCITEGKQGMIHQVHGLAQAMGLTYASRQVKLRLPWHYLPNGCYPLINYAIANINDFSPKHCPRIIITCGKRSIFASLYLKSVLGNRIKTIHIQNPQIATSRFDHVVAPQHDALSGENVISTRFAINHITATLLTQSADALQKHFKPHSRPLTLVILGGTNRHFDFTTASLTSLCQSLTTLCMDGGECVVVPSRRTPDDVCEQFRAWAEQTSNAHFWTDGNFNPYLGLLAICDRVIITADSSSMISESISAKKPTYIYQLPAKRQHNRLMRFIEMLFVDKLAQPLSFPLTPCRTASYSETEHVAGQLLSQV
jgi:mitochondrial fission protein ELM1